MHAAVQEAQQTRALQRGLPRPAFGSSPNSQALSQEAEEQQSKDTPDSIFFEVTIASVDQQKLLSRLSEALVEILSPMSISSTRLQICRGGCAHSRISLFRGT